MLERSIGQSIVHKQGGGRVTMWEFGSPRSAVDVITLVDGSFFSSDDHTGLLTMHLIHEDQLGHRSGDSFQGEPGCHGTTGSPGM